MATASSTARRFVGGGGRFGIGTDSNVRIGVADELRQLEYAQRLFHRARNVMAVAGGSTGRALFDGALRGGAAALRADGGGLARGAPANFVTLDAAHPGFAGCAGDDILDAWIFGAAKTAIDEVWVRGRQLVAAAGITGATRSVRGFAPRWTSCATPDRRRGASDYSATMSVCHGLAVGACSTLSSACVNAALFTPPRPSTRPAVALGAPSVGKTGALACDAAQAARNSANNRGGKNHRELLFDARAGPPD